MMVMVCGCLEVTVSNGEVRRFKTGDAVLVEDIFGKGHATRNIERETIVAKRPLPSRNSKFKPPRSGLLSSTDVLRLTGDPGGFPDQLVGISPFVIVPAHDLHQIAIHNLGELQVDDRGA